MQITKSVSDALKREKVSKTVSKEERRPSFDYFYIVSICSSSAGQCKGGLCNSFRMVIL